METTSRRSLTPIEAQVANHPALGNNPQRPARSPRAFTEHAMAAKEAAEKQIDESQDQGPLLDLSQAAVKKMIATAKSRGYITIDELNEVLPPEQVSSEQIEDVMAMLSEMGINVTDAEESEEEEAPANGKESDAPESTSREVAVASTQSETLDRTDDPVRMYLREMGSVELLSREGEIAIAKRIEAGRNTMIAGLCESPLTFQAITIWREELLSEAIMLREVIDLEATFGQTMESDEDEPLEDAIKGPAVEGAPAAPKPGPRAAAAPAAAPAADGASAQRDEDDEEHDPGNLSLAAMEAALKPQVLETIDRIASDYNRLAAMQESRMSATLSHDGSFTAAQEGEYQRVRAGIVELVNSLHLHNNRIEALVDQLYGINRKIMSLDSAMVKLADSARINRQEFIAEYKGAELEP